MARYKTVIVGCGRRGMFHAMGFSADRDRFDLAACCDLDATRLADFARQFAIPRTYGDAEEMLGREKPDVLCFATLPEVRLPLIELGLRHGVKAIAFEKPMATELAEAHRIHTLCRQAGIKVIVSHQQKYGKHWQKTKEIVDSGEIGEIVKIHATARAWLSQLGTHLMDYMLWFNGGSRVKWVIGHAQGTQMLDDSHPSADFVLGTMEFENGVRGVIECGAHAPHFVPGDNPLRSLPFWTDSSVTVHGTLGYARVVTGNGWQAVTRSSGGKVLSGEGNFDPGYEQLPYIRELGDWLDGRRDGHACNLDITYHGFEATMALYISSLERRKVDLPLETIPSSPIIPRLRKTLPASLEYEGQ
jgi:predicted dehydrogenase